MFYVRARDIYRCECSLVVTTSGCSHESLVCRLCRNVRGHVTSTLIACKPEVFSFLLRQRRGVQKGRELTVTFTLCIDSMHARTHWAESGFEKEARRRWVKREEVEDNFEFYLVDNREKIRIENTLCDRPIISLSCISQ